MNTVIVNLEEASKDLAGVIRRLRESGGRVVLTTGGVPVAKIMPVAQINAAGDGAMASTSATGTDEQSHESDPSRYILSEVTGLWVVAARPGQRMVTSEEIYEELRGSGP